MCLWWGECKSRPSSTGWEATDRHGAARVRKGGGRAVEGLRRGCGGEREIFEQQAGRKGSSYRMGKES